MKFWCTATLDTSVSCTSPSSSCTWMVLALKLTIMAAWAECVCKGGGGSCNDIGLLYVHTMAIHKEKVARQHYDRQVSDPA